MKLIKQLLTTMILGLLPLYALAQPFITTWKTDNPGTSCSSCITIPTTGGGYNYAVDWNNDGIFDQTGIMGDVTHDFGTPGTYTIRIFGLFPRIYFNFGGDKEKILSINQWGSIAWSSMESAFLGASNLTYNATDAPDLSNVTEMRSMFFSATSFNGDLSSWNVSNVTDMSFMFFNAISFNKDLSAWNVSNVTDMFTMFDNSGMDVFNYDQTLIGWGAQSVKSDVYLGAGGLKYCLGQAARSTLINTYGWNIDGDTKNCAAYNEPPLAVCKNLAIEADAECQAEVAAGDFDDGSSDPNADVLTFSANPTGPYSIGTTNVVLTVKDIYNTTSQCSATITVMEDTPPNPVCLHPIITLNGVSSMSLQETDVLDIMASTDNCGEISFVSASPNQVDLSQSGSIVAVTVTVEDGNGNTTFCTADVTVNEPPIAVCKNITIDADGNCQGHTATEDLGEDSSDPNPDALTFSVDPTGPYSFGTTNVVLTVEDIYGAISQCSATITVEDNTPPSPVCLHPTITFNGESSFTLLETDVWDAFASTDNCLYGPVPGGEISFVSLSPNQMDCSQVGNVVAVTVTVEDENGNTASCTANVTIAGLPCDISSTPNGINCSDGSQAGYDPNTSTFTLTADDCYDPNYYSNSDSHAYLGGQLCGDGEIVAQVTGITGSGYAGVAMREDLSASSKMLQLGIDGGNLTKRELRASTGAPAYNHLFQTQGRHWLKLTRSGNFFTAQHSLNGTNWSTVISTTIMMGSCIKVGLYAENNTDGGSMTATFENVEIKTATSLSAPHAGSIDIANSLEPEIRVYPNPAGDEAWIDLGSGHDAQTIITVFNHLGQLVQQIPASAIDGPLVKLSMQNWENGLYWIEVRARDKVETKHLVLQK